MAAALMGAVVAGARTVVAGGALRWLLHLCMELLERGLGLLLRE